MEVPNRGYSAREACETNRSHQAPTDLEHLACHCSARDVGRDRRRRLSTWIQGLVSRRSYKFADRGLLLSSFNNRGVSSSKRSPLNAAENCRNQRRLELEAVGLQILSHCLADGDRGALRICDLHWLLWALFGYPNISSPKLATSNTRDRFAGCNTLISPRPLGLPPWEAFHAF
jgi:hypothetical protein